MAHRSIEEAFKAIKPRGQRGVPSAPTIAIGISSGGDGVSSPLSQAGQQIAQLQAAYQQQVALIAANTDAIQRNTSAQSGRSAASTVGSAASSIFSGLGLLSPLISGIASLFGGRSTPPQLPSYTPPAPISINTNLHVPAPAPSANTRIANTSGSAVVNAPQGAAPPHVTVNVSAMDSQSFMDRSSDIASAVREAMLNMHPINDVVANL